MVNLNGRFVLDFEKEEKQIKHVTFKFKFDLVVVPGGPDKRAAFAQNPLSAPEFHGGGFDAPFLLGPE